MSDTHDGTVEDDGLADSNTISRQGGFGGSSTTFGTIFTKDGMYYALGRPDAYFISYPEPQFVSASPTLIELSSFTAHPASRSVVIRWQTESEINNAGFTIYRADSPNSPYMQINPTLIPAKGSSTQGASYDFIDTNAQNRKTYWYKLADVDLNGTTTMHGPVSATPRLRHGLFQ